MKILLILVIVFLFILIFGKLFCDEKRLEKFLKHGKKRHI
jgi:hypothetical protein